MPESSDFTILLVDDDEIDRELFTDAVALVGKSYSIKQARNGKEALLMLNQAHPLPQLVILDLNMPVLGGRETLREIRQSEKLKMLPVCVMSTSSAQFDVINAYKEGANIFLVKPLEFKELIEMMTSLLNLFRKYVTLPEN